MFDYVDTVIHVHSKVSDSFKVYVLNLIIKALGLASFWTIPH